MLLTEKDYRIQGYHKKMTFDTKGDAALVEFFKNYDEGTKTHSDLKVKEERVYTRDATTKLLIKRTTTITWLEGDGVTAAATKSTVKHYDSQKGFTSNKQANQNIIDKASMYLFSVIGKPDSVAFWKLVKSEVDDYVNVGERQPLLDAVANSNEVYMTGTIKATLDAILNISF